MSAEGATVPRQVWRAKLGMPAKHEPSRIKVLKVRQKNQKKYGKRISENKCSYHIPYKKQRNKNERKRFEKNLLIYWRNH